MKKPWRTLIIDDERPARQRLVRLLNDFTSCFLLCGEAASGDEALDMIEKMKPDIIFLDIQMPGKNVFSMLSELQHQPFVIFCTAFDQYALEAFNTYSVDYLVKPVERERLELTVQKIEKIEKNNNREWYENIGQLRIQSPPVTSITHKSGNKIIPVKIEEIIYFMANDKVVNFYTIQNDIFVTDQTLTMLSQRLIPDFLRISKSLVINRNHIREIHKHFKGRYVFIMNDKLRTRLMSGSLYSSIIKETFEL
jgi:two-component system LytT family response regulator